MSDELPRWLTELRERHGRPDAAAVSTPPHPAVEPGQIRRLTCMDADAPPALVLVISSDHDREAHSVVLASPDTDFGGDRDLLLGPDETGLAYDVIVQAEVSGYAWTVQLDAVVGHVDTIWLDTVLDLQQDEPELPDPDLRAGAPIVSRADPRWPFKVAELERLTVLTGECSRQLVDRTDITVADIASFEPGEDLLGTREFLLELTERVLDGSIVFPAWAFSCVFDDTLAETYRNADLYDAYQALLSLSQTWLDGLDDEWIPDPPAGAGSLMEWTMRALLEQQRRGGWSSVTVLCSRSRFEDQERTVRMSTGRSHVQSVRIPCHP
jgi:hypothetical protein